MTDHTPQLTTTEETDMQTTETSPTKNDASQIAKTATALEFSEVHGGRSMVVQPGQTVIAVRNDSGELDLYFGGVFGGQWISTDVTPADIR